MKILLIFLLCVCTTSVAQIGIIKTSSCSINIKQNKEWGGWEYINVSLIIKINFDTQIIEINNGINDKFKVLSVIESTNGIDSYNNLYTVTTFSCIDRTGIFAVITLQEYDTNDIKIGIYYDNIIYTYKGVKLFE